MRMLQIHSDGFSYEAKRKALKNIPDLEEKVYRTDDSCLVNFIAAETSDETNITGAATKTAEMIAAAAEEVKEKNVVIYPWVHLSETPAKPNSAIKLLKDVASDLKKRGAVWMVQSL